MLFIEYDVHPSGQIELVALINAVEEDGQDPDGGAWLTWRCGEFDDHGLGCVAVPLHDLEVMEETDDAADLRAIVEDIILADRATKEECHREHHAIPAVPFGAGPREHRGRGARLQARRPFRCCGGRSTTRNEARHLPHGEPSDQPLRPRHRSRPEAVAASDSTETESSRSATEKRNMVARPVRCDDGRARRRADPTHSRPRLNGRLVTESFSLSRHAFATDRTVRSVSAAGCDLST